MSLRRPRPTGHRGDTIVEVMMVLTVLGLAISIAYATANRSLLDARQAQEASQAAELIQAQLEGLRTMVNNPQFQIDGVTPNPDYILNFPEPVFCVSNVGGTFKVAHPSDAGQPCHLNNLYDLTVTYNRLNSAGGNFRIVATWDDVEGQSTDTATLAYNLYKLPS